MKAKVVIGVFKTGTWVGDKEYPGLEIHSGKDDERFVFLPTFRGPIKIWWNDKNWYGEVDAVTRRGR